MCHRFSRFFPLLFQIHSRFHLFSVEIKASLETLICKSVWHKTHPSKIDQSPKNEQFIWLFARRQQIRSEWPMSLPIPGKQMSALWNQLLSMSAVAAIQLFALLQPTTVQCKPDCRGSHQIGAHRFNSNESAQPNLLRRNADRQPLWPQISVPLVRRFGPTGFESTHQSWHNVRQHPVDGSRCDPAIQLCALPLRPASHGDTRNARGHRPSTPIDARKTHGNFTIRWFEVDERLA